MTVVKSNQNIQFAQTSSEAGLKDFIVKHDMGLFIVSYRQLNESQFDGYCILRVYDNQPVLVALTGMKNSGGQIPLTCYNYTTGTHTVRMNVFQYCNVLFITN